MGGSENPINIFTTLARHPVLLKRFLVFGNHMLFECTLEPRERQLLILRTGYLCKSKYEWGHHVLIGKRVGLSEEEIARVKQGPSAPGWSRRQATLVRAVDELHGDQMIGDETWAALSEFFDERRLIEIVMLVGLYMTVSMSLNTLGVQLDTGIEVEPDFPE